MASAAVAIAGAGRHSITFPIPIPNLSLFPARSLSEDPFTNTYHVSQTRSRIHIQI